MSGKQYKTVGEDLWKNRTEKVVSIDILTSMIVLSELTFKFQECGAIYLDVWSLGGTAYKRL